MGVEFVCLHFLYISLIFFCPHAMYGQKVKGEGETGSDREQTWQRAASKTT